jgi:cytochrome c553
LDSAPRLAGQHPGYIERRMAAFGSEAYVDGTIHRNEKALTEDQVRQLATYLTSE